MTVERRLREALHQVDEFQPSLDLFARVKRSVAEDARFRRRRMIAVLGSLLVAGALAGFVASATRLVDGTLVVATWRLVLVDLALAGALITTIAPNIRRFARSYVDDVFHLSPVTGGRFLAVLDLAYYLFFGGLALVDFDQWDVASRVGLAVGLEMLADRIGLLILVMGVLHAINIASLPLLGLIINSTTRRALRARAGISAPPESARARRVEANTKGIVVALVALAVSAVFAVILGLVGGQV